MALTAQQLREINPTISDEQVNFAQGVEAQNAIGSDDLKGTKDFLIPPSTPTTQADNLLGSFEAAGTQYGENLAKDADKAENTMESSLQDYIGASLGSKGQTELTAEGYAASGGVDDINKELDNINHQLLQEQNGLRRQVERIEKNETGMSAQALSDEVYRVTRDSVRKQADLSIIQMGIQGRYDSAKAIADRAVQVQLERDKRKNEALKEIYTFNKDLFTIKEQRAFEAAQADRERALNKEESRLTGLYDLQIKLAQAGAPQSVIGEIQKFEDLGKALTYASSYLAPKVSAKTEVIDINGRKLLINSQTGEVISDFGSFNGPVGEESAYQKERRGRIKGSVSELLDRTTAQTVGFASLGKYVPGSVQRDYKADLETLKANISFSELQAMREASKTGGALGNVAIRELELLESTLGALDQGQTPYNMRKNLEKIQGSLDTWYSAVENTSEDDQLRAAGYSEAQIQEIKKAQ